jgi:oleate hydratase
MKAHIVGGGFGGLAAAAYLIRDAGMSGQDITIYEVGDRLGGAFSLAGSAATGYILPAGALFDAEFRCTFDLLATIPSAGDPAISVKDEFFAFNKRYPFHDRAHIVDRDGHIVHSPHFGLSVRDRLDLVRLALTPEAMLDGRRVEEFFSPHFFTTEFWLLWTTIMNPKPQSSAMEMRRFMNRFLRMLPDLSVMSHVLRTRFDQYEAIIEPMVAWLRPRGVTFLTGAFVRDIGFAPSPGRITASRLDYERDGAATSVAVAPEDVVLVTLGSQVADLSVGSMTEAPQPRRSGRPWALWERLAQGRTDFGNPDVFFGTAQVPDAHWVTFTVTTTGTEFFDQMTVLTGNEPGSGGLVTLKNSSWLVTLSIFHQPEAIGQPPGTRLWWGYSLYPERNGDFVAKHMDTCTGAEILEEVLRQLRFDRQLDAIMASSICIPCDMPYVNNVWVPRRRTDRPRAVPEGATNLGFLGQYAEVPQEPLFTIEYSARTAWEAIHRLLRRGPAPPPVYQGQYDPAALFAALKTLA